jgi:hypothetical protein
MLTLQDRLGVLSFRHYELRLLPHTVVNGIDLLPRIRARGNGSFHGGTLAATVLADVFDELAADLLILFSVTRRAIVVSANFALVTVVRSVHAALIVIIKLRAMAATVYVSTVL